MDRSEDQGLRLFLNRLLARSVLDEREQHAILALPVHPVHLRRKQDFVQIYEETTYSCLITSGLVARFGQSMAGARQITALHIPGDMADLHSAVRPVGIGGLTALCETTVLRIPHSAIRATAASHPAIAEAFWRNCLLDAAILMEWIVNTGRRDARTRLAHIICEMAIRSGENCQPLQLYPFPITQDQLGEAAGLTSVHVNRSLKTLKHLVTLKSEWAQIHNWKALAEAGGFDPTYLVADTLPEQQRQLIVVDERSCRTRHRHEEVSKRSTVAAKSRRPA